MSSVRLVIVSDIHGSEHVLQWLPKLLEKRDLVIVAGDASHWGEYNFYLKFYNTLSKTNRHIFFVPGNHDPVTKFDLPRVICLHGSCLVLRRRVFCGLGGSNVTPFNTPFELMDDDAERILARVRYRPEIFVSHAPPFDTRCDRTNEGRHVGSSPVRRFVESLKPLITITGHVHESRAIDRLGETVIINPGPACHKFYATATLNHEPTVELLEV